ncbi:sigma-70 family RNA polymerase sigma factor [Actinoplanes bogorensis]|uniref:Sigma-70 family RNA polymerase sigma factor n=1 Tax=Paractinoplanes bogorensis TaxID=1610840 RepID=A0ABS5Z509_9ACTN|nr:sigma-70 family RNA polymerase sigma factor [Actinoplanes bogorensis]MBU2670778.1 sigma-70 family RNA polymerase sigma factor [Actinoplanes bogorensis]
MSSELDDDLVVAARGGDPAARQELAARCLPLVYTVVGRAAERDLDVDDIVQETMVDLMTGLPGLREPGRLRSWVVTVALRRLADARGAAREQRLARAGGLTELSERPDPASDFSGLVILRQALTREQRDVAEATRWLDPANRDLLSLWWLEIGGHLTRGEVAAAVGRPASHVAVQVQRMREQLDTSRRVVAGLRGGDCAVLADVTESWDGEPDPLWRKRIARHLQSCPACAEGGRRLIAPERLLAGLPLLVPPPGSATLAAATTASGTAKTSGAASTSGGANIGHAATGVRAGTSLLKFALPAVAAIGLTAGVVACRPDQGGPTEAAPPPVAVVTPSTRTTTEAPKPSPTPTGTATTAPATKAPKSTGFVYPAPGDRAEAAGRLPARATKSENLGQQKTNLGTNIIRDLGFSGVVSGQSLWTYGDTILDKEINGIKPMAYDAVALGIQDDPSKINFKNLGGFGQPDNWVPLTARENATGGVSRFAMGGTNVIEYAPGQGLVYYLKNDRQGGVNRLLGAGVARVKADKTGATATRTRPVHSANTGEDKDTLLWGPDDPWYGDIGITYDPRDKKVYAYGNGPDKGIYLARVPAARADDVTAYEYWDESRKAWYTGLRKVGEKQAIFGLYENYGQSNAFWSNHYNAWMYVTSGDFLGKTIAVRTAPKLEGPWTRLTKVSDACPAGDGACYAVAPHPEYDETGRTVLVSYTQVAGDKMTLHLRRVTFE